MFTVWLGKLKASENDFVMFTVSTNQVYAKRKYFKAGGRWIKTLLISQKNVGGYFLK